MLLKLRLGMTQCFPSFYLSSPERSRIFTLRQSPVTPLLVFRPHPRHGSTWGPQHHPSSFLPCLAGALGATPLLGGSPRPRVWSGHWTGEAVRSWVRRRPESTIRKQCRSTGHCAPCKGRSGWYAHHPTCVPSSVCLGWHVL